MRRIYISKSFRGNISSQRVCLYQRIYLSPNESVLLSPEECWKQIVLRIAANKKSALINFFWPSGTAIRPG